jgi:Flp pilus assembly protein TadD
MGTPFQVHQFARELMTDKRTEEALTIFTENAQKHTDLWFVHDGLARVYSSRGKFDKAAMEVRTALINAPADQKGDLNDLLKRLEANQDINR